MRYFLTVVLLVTQQFSAETMEPRQNVITKAQLEQIVQKYFVSVVNDQKHKYSIEAKNLPDSIVAPLGIINYNFQTLSKRQTQGNVIFSLSIEVDGRCCKKITTSALIRTFDNVLIARSNLLQHQSLTESELSVENRETTRLDGNFIQVIDSVKNFRTRRFIPANSIITKDEIEQIPLVQRGDVVSLIVKLNGITITTLGKALKPGCKNDYIEVLNLESKKRLHGEIIGENQVLIQP
jgi:flagella basal body P-ring formation protein FlgA